MSSKLEHAHARYERAVKEFESALREYAANGAGQDDNLRSAAEARLQAARELMHAICALEPDLEEASWRERSRRA